MPTISLGRALADPNLFARHFRNKSWAGWKTFLRALFAEPPGPDDLEIYRARTGRTAWPAAAFAEAAVIVGVRLSAWTRRYTDGKAAQEIVPPRPRIP